MIAVGVEIAIAVALWVTIGVAAFIAGRPSRAESGSTIDRVAFGHTTLGELEDRYGAGTSAEVVGRFADDPDSILVILRRSR